MEAYDEKFRGEVLAACDAGEATREVALRFDVSESWVRRIKQRRRESGQVAPKKAKPRTPKWRAWADWLKAKVESKPDIYLWELQAALKEERGEQAGLQTLCNACRELGLSPKKRR